MMRGKEQRAAFAPMKESPAAVAKEEVWEVRPGGMLVQKRSPDADPPPGGAPVPTIRVKVKFNGVYHEIYINSQASFGELKKLLSEKTGLHPDDQKVVYKDKERDSKAFLDMAGVKDRSKMVMLEDPAAKAKRLLEERRTSKAERAAKSISRISLDVDKLASKVSALETIVSKGGKVVEADVVTLTEALMNELVKLDSIAADGEVKAQRRVQEKRVQKYVETLDAIRVKNKTTAAVAPRANGHAKARSPHLPPRPPPAQQQHQQRRQFQQPAPTTGTAPAPQTATASWETFDLLSSVPSTSAAPVTTMAPATTTTPSPRFEWELF
ncbi:BAG family molecular chaperone regulator 1-like [Phragmites australis]|uniref:BAG family molecular chaperone regulator 1-like n=1 Tax=Phragmites australis TaxID=29695 RepID=UPI002D77557A|nr:BAG family molecular chaperone regulator 1-like [Phragmites australis]